jgi:hypothetical protein
MGLVANAFEYAAEVSKVSRLANMKRDFHDASHRNDAYAVHKSRCLG